MARKLDQGEPGSIICPACQSKISSDGKALQSRSEFLKDLIEGEEELRKFEAAIGLLEKRLREAQEKIKELESKPQPQPAPAKEGESGRKTRVGRLW